MERTTRAAVTDAFDQAVLREAGTIRAIGRERLHRRDELDDFAQEVVLRAYAYRDQARRQDTVGAWVRAIARNTALNWNARKRPTTCADLPDLPDAVLSAGHQLEREERYARLVEALSRLGETDRARLVAHVVDGVPYTELMARHGLSRGTVGVRLHRTRARLRRSLRHAVGTIGAAVAWRQSEALGGVVAMQMKWGVGAGVALIAGAFALGSQWLAPEQETDGSTATDGITRAPVTQPGGEGISASAETGAIRRAAGRRSSSAASSTRSLPSADQAAIGAARDRSPTLAPDSPTVVAADSEHTQGLYGEFARVHPLYIDAIERYTQAIATRPKRPASDAPEDAKEAFRKAFRAHRREVMNPIGDDIRRYENDLQRLFPMAVTVVDDPERGRVWTLDEDAVRRAIGGRLPNDPSGS